jgi:hypothetical protein
MMQLVGPVAGKVNQGMCQNIQCRNVLEGREEYRLIDFRELYYENLR